VRKTEEDSGAYLLHLELLSTVRLRVGSLGDFLLVPGRYVYVGSARRGIGARIERHRRLALEKVGKTHWHIDYLLVRRELRWIRAESFPNTAECVLSRRIASRNGVIIPIPRFGASDCRRGCGAHFFLFAREVRRPHTPEMSRS